MLGVLKKIVSKDVAEAPTALKTGYLVKKAIGKNKRDEGNWRKRYFVLTEQNLTYYVSDGDLTSPKGDVLLTSDALVQHETDSMYDKKFCFSVTTPAKVLYVSAPTATSRTAWIMEIQAAIRKLHSHLLRGYLQRRAVDGDESSWERKWFMLSADVITYHADENSTKKPQGSLKLSHKTVVDTNLSGYSSNGGHMFQVSTKGKSMMIGCEGADEREQWSSSILANVAALPVEPGIDDDCKGKGYMQRRVQSKGGEGWVRRYFVLKEGELRCYLDEHQDDPESTFPLTTETVVYKTVLRQNSFQVVTSQEVLHVAASTPQAQQDWMASLAGEAQNSDVSAEQSIREEAMLREDEFYDVRFGEKRTLGLTLSQCHEWAVVKCSDEESNGVSVGSVLSGVNGQSVILAGYSAAVSAIRGWQPPLTLTFRKAPTKRGVLCKLATVNKMKIWHNRYVSLANGTMSYSNTDTSPVRYQLSMIGTSVSLVPYSETGQFFCFRLVSGAGNITFKALTSTEMWAWAGALYHAIAVANGTGYLLEEERARVQDDEAAEHEKTLHSHLSVERESLEEAEKEAAAVAAAAAAAAAEMEAKREEAQKLADAAKAQADEAREKEESARSEYASRLYEQRQSDKDAVQRQLDRGGGTAGTEVRGVSTFSPGTVDAGSISEEAAAQLEKHEEEEMAEMRAGAEEAEAEMMDQETLKAEVSKIVAGAAAAAVEDSEAAAAADTASTGSPGTPTHRRRLSVTEALNTLPEEDKVGGGKTAAAAATEDDVAHAEAEANAADDELIKAADEDIEAAAAEAEAAALEAERAAAEATAAAAEAADAAAEAEQATAAAAEPLAECANCNSALMPNKPKYSCMECKDFSLCVACEAKLDDPSPPPSLLLHDPNHILAKIRPSHASAKAGAAAALFVTATKAAAAETRSRGGSCNSQSSASSKGSIGRSIRNSIILESQNLLALRDEHKTRQDLKQAFANITDGEPSSGLKLPAFAAVVRGISGGKDPERELEMFEVLGNSTGTRRRPSRVDEEQFVEGVLQLKDEALVAGLRRYAASIMVAL